MGHDPDWVTTEAFEQMIADDYFENPRLMDQAWKRDETFKSAFGIGSPVAHMPWDSIEPLYEARIAYALGLYRSCIVCAVSAIDGEFKRQLIEAGERADRVSVETFGGSIKRLEKLPSHLLFPFVKDLLALLEVRNRVGAHMHTAETLLTSYDEVRDKTSEGVWIVRYQPLILSAAPILTRRNMAKLEACREDLRAVREIIAKRVMQKTIRMVLVCSRKPWSLTIPRGSQIRMGSSRE